MSEKESSSKIVALQGLRGYAMLLIFLSHYTFVQNKMGENMFWAEGGYGVEIFLLLSGYLAALNYDRGKRNSLWFELKNKVCKFYPLHICTLIVALPFSIMNLLRGKIVTWLALVMNATMLQSFIPVQQIYFSYNSVSWYLTVVIFLIVITPLVMKFLVNVSIKKLTLGIIGIYIFQLLWWFAMKDTSIAHWLIYICPMVRALDFCVGASVFYITKFIKNNIQDFSKAQGKIHITFFISVVVSVMMMICSFDSKCLIYTVAVWTLPCAGILVSIVLGSQKSLVLRALFENKIIVFLGNISFEFFLWHQLVITYCKKLGSYVGINGGVLLGIAAFILAIIASIVTQYLFKYILIFRKREKI